MEPSHTEPPLLILAQYVKDLSFENPNAPEIYSQIGEHQPEVSISVDVVPTRLEERTYEVVLSLRARATSGEKVAFLVELDYAGIVRLGQGLDAAERERQVFSEAPRHLFPFARNVLADTTREASFPPVVVNPINFDSYYARHKKDTLEPRVEGGAEAAASSSG